MERIRRWFSRSVGADSGDKDFVKDDALVSRVTQADSSLKVNKSRPIDIMSPQFRPAMKTKSIEGDDLTGEGNPPNVTNSQQVVGSESPTEAPEFDDDEPSLSEQQQRLFDLLEGYSGTAFVTGNAGTGKSVLLRHLKANTQHSCLVVAPTGVAAVNVGGETIHSRFGLPTHFVSREDLEDDKYRFTRSDRGKLLGRVRLLVIDEISMVRADLLDAIDVRMQQASGTSLPFGGATVVAFGDIFQLPPVIRRDDDLLVYLQKYYGGIHFFQSKVWQARETRIFELTYNFRQKDERFREILSSARLGSLREPDLKDLNDRIVGSDRDLDDNVITITTTNANANQINLSQLARLSGEPRTYEATVSGNFPKDRFPVDEFVTLKPGAQVMCVKNMRYLNVFNGMIGKVVNLQQDHVIVEFDGNERKVEFVNWDNYEHVLDKSTGRIVPLKVGELRQLPLRLGWGITVHKSQGQTFDSVCIDLHRGSFVSGQSYVALSRCRSLNGLYLRKPITRSDFWVDKAALQFLSRSEIEDFT